MFLGIDLGTTELKVLLLADDGHVVGTARYPLEISRPRHRWSEQDPEDWWRATRIALATLRKNYPDAFARIQAIGLSGQMHGAVLLDANDRPLRPAIFRNDMRSVSECTELTARAPRLHEIAGNCAMPGLTAPKLLWVARHEPEHFAGLDALRADGTRETSLSLIGGGARSTFWTQLIADAFGVSIRRPPDAQCIAALGAARIGWLAVGGDFAAVVRTPSLSQEFFPHDERHSILLERLASYRTLYRQLRPLFAT